MKLHARRTQPPMGTDKFLAAFEGLEGGFAIGAGVLAGMSFIATIDRSTLLIAAIVSVIVNGFNSASVKYSSEHYMDELDGHEKKDKMRYYFMPALVQFIAYFAISLISIAPLFFVRDNDNAILYSCILTVIALLFAGYWRASLLRMPRWRDGFETAILGAGIIFIGYTSGWMIHVIIGA